jgi:hypothetical protein
VRADRGGGYVRGYTVYRGEKVLFQDSQNLGSQGSLDMYTLHEVNTKLLLSRKTLRIGDRGDS